MSLWLSLAMFVVGLVLSVLCFIYTRIRYKVLSHVLGFDDDGQ